jgi:hypothetical protein
MYVQRKDGTIIYASPYAIFSQFLGTTCISHTLESATLPSIHCQSLHMLQTVKQVMCGKSSL